MFIGIKVIKVVSIEIKILKISFILKVFKILNDNIKIVVVVII